jgi:hypothetical protein
MLIKCIIYTIIYIGLLMSTFIKQIRYNFKFDHRGRGRMVAGFTTTYVISAYHH